MKRVKLSFVACLYGFLLSTSPIAGATVIIDPVSGWTGGFQWTGGLGQIDSINGNMLDRDWSITAAADSQMTFATVFDWYLPGDEFAFVLDGTQIAWSTTYFDSFGYFHGELSNFFLSAGTHLFTINVTMLDDTGFTSGGAFAQFSGLTEIAGVPVPVPEPGILPLLAIGLLVVLSLTGAIDGKRPVEQHNYYLRIAVHDYSYRFRSK